MEAVAASGTELSSVVSGEIRAEDYLKSIELDSRKSELLARS
jgi:hypothetical protein